MLDATTVDYAESPDELAAELGYSPSEAIRIFEACVKTRSAMRRLLGPELYEKAAKIEW